MDKPVVSKANLLAEFEELIGISFKDKGLLRQALTHESFAIESTDNPTSLNSNERLEFLGDSILNAIVSSYLYSKYPDQTEGYLSKRKSYLVSRRVIKKWAQKLNLNNYLFLGRGEERSKKGLGSLLANGFEAVVGAIYLDKGFGVAEKFVLKRVKEEIFESVDFKSQLQERLQKEFQQVPAYRIVTKSGPAHAPLFEVEVKIGGEKLGEGKGDSRKDAEQDAAQQALKNLH